MPWDTLTSTTQYDLPVTGSSSAVSAQLLFTLQMFQLLVPIVLKPEADIITAGNGDSILP